MVKWVPRCALGARALRSSTACSSDAVLGNAASAGGPAWQTVLALIALLDSGLVRHPSGDLRSSQSAVLPIGHCPAGGSGAETAGQPHPFGCAPSLARPLRAHCVRPNSLPVNLSRGVCTQQQTPRAGDTGKAGQGRSAAQDRESGGAYARRTPGRDDVGTTPQASLRHRYRDLPGLRRSGANHRLYRGSGCDSDDPCPLEDKTRNLRTLPVTRKPGAAWSAVRLTSSPSFNPGCCSLEAHGRVPAGRPPEMARAWR
jgi:hypothetical protein